MDSQKESFAISTNRSVLMFDAYLTYCDHCRIFGREPPTREWWDQSIATHQSELRVINDHIFQYVRDGQADADRERREGWANE